MQSTLFQVALKSCTHRSILQKIATLDPHGMMHSYESLWRLIKSTFRYLWNAKRKREKTASLKLIQFDSAFINQSLRRGAQALDLSVATSHGIDDTDTKILGLDRFWSQSTWVRAESHCVCQVSSLTDLDNQTVAPKLTWLKCMQINYVLIMYLYNSLKRKALKVPLSLIIHAPSIQILR